MRAMKRWIQITFMITLTAAFLLISASCAARSSQSASQSAAGSEDGRESVSTETSSAEPEKQSETGQQGKEGPILIAICQSADQTAMQDAASGFEEAVKARLGDQVSFLTENAENDPARYKSIMESFGEKGADLILANGTGALRAAVSARGSGIPVVGITSLDYSSAVQGLPEAENRSKWKITSTSGAVPLEKQAAMFAELLPETKKIGILYCSDEYVSSYQAQHIRKYLEDTGYRCSYYSYADTRGLSDAAVEAAGKCDALYIPADHMAAANMQTIDEICREAKTPVITAEESICAGCGIASLAPSWYELGRIAGEQAAAILCDGEDPGKIEHQYAAYFRRIYVSSRSRELGIAIPGNYIDLEESGQ